MHSKSLLICLILIIYNAPRGNTLDIFKKLCNVKDFEDFLQQTGKSYPSPEEYAFRESIFMGTKSLVDYTNRNLASKYKLEINPLADMTMKERSKLLGSKLHPVGEEISVQHTNFAPSKISNDNLPESFDWRELGGVTPPSFQGFTCGSCWSFATVGCLEGHLYRRTGVLVDLSEQHLMDCSEDYGTDGCDGGFQEYAFEYIRDFGISLENKYPYIQSDNQICQRNETQDPDVLIRDYAVIRPDDEQKMKEVIATLGPLACSMNAAPLSFQEYSGGIYADEACNEDDLNHSVVVVGYGTQNGTDYWIIKNSFSENWGEKGFMRLLRNHNGFCGIAKECSYPIL